KHEQSGIIQDELGQMSEADARALSKVMTLDFDANNLHVDPGTVVSFDLCMHRHGRDDASVTNFDNRWLWIEEEVLPTWRRVDEQGKEVSHLMARLQAPTTRHARAGH